MNITVQVDEVSLNSVVGDIIGWDEEGDPVNQGGQTVARLVADRIVERLRGDRDGWDSLSHRYCQVRDEAIREAVAPLITEALTKPLPQTNGFGETTGPTTTLRDIIAAEARKMLTQPADSYDRTGRTIVQKIVADQVRQAMSAEIAGAVKQARALIADEVGQRVASAVQAAMKAK